MLVLLAALALAEPGDPNVEPSFRLGIVRGPETGHRWGVELGASFRLAVGDHCNWSEVDCQSSQLWPVVGPTASIAWRGGDRVDALVGVLGGVGVLDMHQMGFFPEWELVGVAGWSMSVGAPSALGLGFDVGRALAYDNADKGRTYGWKFLALRCGATTRWRPGARLERPTLRSGLELSFMAGDYQ